MCHSDGGQEGRLGLDWVQQILHGAPGEGRATLRSHALATHDSGGSKWRFPFCGQSGGGPGGGWHKFYVLPTPELKRAKVTKGGAGWAGSLVGTLFVHMHVVHDIVSLQSTLGVKKTGSQQQGLFS